MGIFKLMQLLRMNAPGCLKQHDMSYYSGQSIALDASMAMYQFIISTQGYDHNALTSLTDNQGNKTGHLVGLFNRTITLLEYGIKPVWVFDGKPPMKKNGELLRRRRIKDEATEKAGQAKDIGDLEEALKQQQRTTSITRKEKEDAMKMLRLMGVPVIQAPGEAQAQCAYLCKVGKVDCVGTQDMDALTFGAKVLLREINQKKEPVTEINHQQMLKELKLSEEQFIDMCILCGCDYVPKISGIGPVKAYKLIEEYRTMEKVLEYLYGENKGCEEGKNKYGMPKGQDFCYEDARDLFKNPPVDKEVELKWDKNATDEEGLKQFLVKDKNFSEQRVQGGIKKIKASTTKGVQPRLEAFFGKPTVIKHSDMPRPLDKKKGGKSKSATKRK